jgi:hypothetical protein
MEPGAEHEGAPQEPGPPMAPPSEPLLQSDPTDAAPEEVEFDATVELDRLHQAQRFATTPQEQEFDDSYGVGGYQRPTAMRYEPVVAPKEEQQEDLTPTSRELYTLEDCYSLYPEIGGGNYYLRVFRKHPTTYGGIRCSGFIEDIHEQISMQDFASRFGGHTYEVLVRGPGSRSATLGPDGRAQARTLSKVRLDVPGSPIISTTSGQDTMTQQQAFFGRGGDDPRIELKRLDIEAESRRRQEKREEDIRRVALSGTSLSPDMLEQMERQATARAAEVRSASTEIMHTLKRESDRLASRNEVLETKNQELRESMMRQQTEMTLKLKEEETHQIRELKERHSEEIRRIKEDQAANALRMESEHRRAMQEITESTTRERDHLQKMEQMERERIRTDAERREQSLLSEHARRESQTRETFETRIKDVERSYDRELRGIKDMRDREIESIRSSEKGASKFTEKTAEIQVSVMQGEIARLSASSDALSRENEALRAQINKPPLEAVREAHEIASMTGYKSGGEEEDFDWKKGLFKAVGSLIDKGPEMAKGLGEAREQNRIAVARAQHQARVAQARAQAVQQRRPAAQMASPMPHMATPEPPAQHRPPPPPGVVPQRTWDDPSGPPEPGQAVGVPPVGGGPPMMDEEPPHYVNSAAPPGPQQPPITGGQARSNMPAPAFTERTPEAQQPEQSEQHEQHEPELDPFADDQAAQGHDDEAVEPEPLAITPQMVSRFSEQLELAISTGVVTAEQFAQKFVAEAGPVATKQILDTIGPDQLVDAVANEAGGNKTAIVTRAGRKFVQELWVEARKIVG